MTSFTRRLVSQGSGAALAAVVTLSMTANDHRATALARNIGHTSHVTSDVARLSGSRPDQSTAKSSVDFDPMGTVVIHRYP